MRLFLSCSLFLALFSSAHSSVMSQEARTAALDLFRTGRYGDLVRSYRSSDVDDDSTKLIVALSYKKLGLMYQSGRVLRELYTQRTHLRSFAAYLLGRHSEELKDMMNAVRWYRNALDSTDSHAAGFPTSADRRAIALASLERLRSIALAAGNADGTASGSTASAPAGTYSETVMKIMGKASSRYPVALYHLGLLFLNKGDVERAVRTFIGALTSGNDPRVRQKVLETLTGDFRLIEEAHAKGLSKSELIKLCLEEELFRNALFVSYLLPYEAEVARLRALCFFLMGDYPSAALLYNEYFIQFKDPEGLLKTALAYYNAGDRESAKTYFARYARGSEPLGLKDPDAISLKLRLERDDVPPATYLEGSESFVYNFGSYPGLDRVIQETFYYTLQKKMPDQALVYLKNAYGAIKDPLFRAWGTYILALYLDSDYYIEALSQFPGSYYYHMAAKKLVLDTDLLTKADSFHDTGNFENALALYIQLFSKGIGGSYVRNRIAGIIGRNPHYSHFYELEKLESGELASVLFTLYRAGLYSELEDLIDAALSTEGEREDFFYYYLLSRMSYAKGKPFDGIQSAEAMLKSIDGRYAIFLPVEILKLLYPPAYREEIKGQLNGASMKFDDLFILSIIREESRYNERAQSKQGAMGLMQVLPSTARWIRKGHFNRADLFDPALNIQTGILYLRYLSGRFDTEASVLAAYNGGPSNVRKWLTSASLGNDQKFIEEIPYPETRNYVKKVLTTYEMYRSLYGSSSIVE